MSTTVLQRKKTTGRSRNERYRFPPLWQESLWVLDWLALRLSPVYRGIGVPRGDGSAVVLVPGFMGTDLYLTELYFWLRRMGYRPYMSAIGMNAQCPGRLAKRLLRTMEQASGETGRPVRVVGHSLGGIIGRSACQQRPDLASQLIYVGSPVRGVHANQAIQATVSLVRVAVRGGSRDDCLTESCRCGFGRSAATPLPPSVTHAAIYTRVDAVVDWRDSQERDSRLNHEVGGTHVGLVYNPRAYRVLAHLLAGPGLSTPAGRGP